MKLVIPTKNVKHRRNEDTETTDPLTFALEVSMNRVICVATKITRTTWLSKSGKKIIYQIGRAGSLWRSRSISSASIMRQGIEKYPGKNT